MLSLQGLQFVLKIVLKVGRRFRRDVIFPLLQFLPRLVSFEFFLLPPLLLVTLFFEMFY